MIPKAPWWPDFQRDGMVRMKPEKLQAAVEKAAAGQPLGEREARAVRWLVDESVRNPATEQFEDETYTEDPTWLGQGQDPVSLEPGEEREAFDIVQKGLEMGLDIDTIEPIVERAAQQDITDDDIIQQFKDAIPGRSLSESREADQIPAKEQVPAQAPTGQVATDLFGATPVTAQALANKQLQVDQKLGKGREDVYVPGDMLDENLSRQADLTDVPRGAPVKVKPKVPAKTESELIDAGLIQPGASKLAVRAGRWQYR
ncbi:MAG TPA: hypothetical protein VJ417_16370, partial [Candidatus Glassbacteria bacterium]|nr:hypothetical protein [Candidatus Glassbacteria bacterium]